MFYSTLKDCSTPTLTPALTPNPFPRNNRETKDSHLCEGRVRRTEERSDVEQARDRVPNVLPVDAVTSQSCGCHDADWFACSDAIVHPNASSAPSPETSAVLIERKRVERQNCCYFGEKEKQVRLQ